MDVIFFLIGCSLFVALVFLGAFLWATRTGQYEDTTTPAYRILFDPTASATPTDTPETNPETTQP